MTLISINENDIHYLIPLKSITYLYDYESYLGDRTDHVYNLGVYLGDGNTRTFTVTSRVYNEVRRLLEKEKNND